MMLSQQQLKQTCATGEFQYLVTSRDLGIDPVAEVPSTSGPTSKKIRLYRCSAQVSVPHGSATLVSAQEFFPGNLRMRANRPQGRTLENGVIG